MLRLRGKKTTGARTGCIACVSATTSLANFIDICTARLIYWLKWLLLRGMVSLLLLVRWIGRAISIVKNGRWGAATTCFIRCIVMLINI